MIAVETIAGGTINAMIVTAVMIVGMTGTVGMTVDGMIVGVVIVTGGMTVIGGMTEKMIADVTIETTAVETAEMMTVDVAVGMTAELREWFSPPSKLEPICIYLVFVKQLWCAYSRYLKADIRNN